MNVHVCICVDNSSIRIQGQTYVHVRIHIMYTVCMHELTSSVKLSSPVLLVKLLLLKFVPLSETRAPERGVSFSPMIWEWG